MTKPALCLVTLLATVAACGKVTTTSPDGGGDDVDAAAGDDPVVTITSHPDNPTSQTTAMFAFAADGPATFECRMNSDAFAACTSPQSYAGLAANTNHTFTVRATSGAGRTGTATHAWTIDTVPPTVSITSGPASSVESSTADFVFTSEANTLVECQLDGGAFTVCSSPTGQSYTGVAVGAHTFTVRATDQAGNAATATHSWTVVAPCTPTLIEAESLTTGWSTAFGSVLHGGQALDTSVVNNSFTFNFSGRGLIIYYRRGPSAGSHSVRIDSGSPVAISATASAWSYQNPTTVATGLANGNHTATVICTAASCQIDYFDVTCN